MERSVHVRPSGDAWIVMREGQTDPITTHRTIDDATYMGREIARDEHGTLVIYNADGSVRHSERFTAPAVRRAD